MSLFPFALLALVLCTLPAGASGDDGKRLQGRWQAVEAELAGGKLPAEATHSVELTLGDGDYLVKLPEGSDRGTYEVESHSRPRRMKIRGTDGPNQGKTILAIYRLHRGKLHICYDLTGTDYPREFKTTKQDRLFLVTYQKQ